MLLELNIDALDKDAILLDIERARQNRLWLSDRIETLREKFVNTFVAVDNGKVIASDDDYERLLSLLKERSYNINLVAIEYIPEEDYIIVI